MKNIFKLSLIMLTVTFVLTACGGGSGGSESGSGMSIALDKTTITLLLDGTDQLTETITPDTALNKDVTWSSSHPEFVSVSQTGLVTAVSVGASRITVTMVDGGAQAYCDVTASVSAAIVYVDIDATGTGDGSSWVNAYTNFAAAILNAISTGKTVFVAEGTYPININIGGSVAVYGGFSGNGNERDLVSHATILDGGNLGRVLYIYADLSAVVLDGLLITKGQSTLNGAGIFINANTPAKIKNCSIKNNISDALGGGMRILGSSPEIINCKFENNSAVSGGAICCEILTTYAASPQITNCTFNNNSALTGDGFGGAIYNESASPTFTDCTFNSNSAIVGGAFYNDTSTATIVNCVVSYNTSAENGGGVYNLDSVFNADLSGIEYNTATGNGGGIYNNNSTTWIDASRIQHNSATYGGGVYNDAASLLDVDMGGYEKNSNQYCSIDNNTAGMYGGGVYCRDNSEADVRQCSLIGNQASAGGAIYAHLSPIYAFNCVFYGNDATGGIGDAIRLFTDSKMSSSNCTFYYNGSGTGAAVSMSGAALTLSNSIIWGHSTSINDAAQTVTYSDVEGGYAGAGNLNVDPQFVNTGNGIGADGIWGTADDGLNLGSGSPAIDKISSGQSVDIAGTARPVTLHTPATPYDMGAYEAH